MLRLCSTGVVISDQLLRVGAKVRIVQRCALGTARLCTWGRLDRVSGDIREVLPGEKYGHDYLVGDAQSDGPRRGFGWFRADELEVIG